MLPLLLLMFPDAHAGTRRADRFVRRAEQALLEGDTAAAWQLAGQALERDAGSTRAMGIQAVLLISSATPDNPRAAELLSEGMTLTRRLAELDPASPYLPLCQRILAEVTDPILITESVPDCPADAVEQHRLAEAAFSRRDLDVAGTHYRRALHLCPEATSWWTYYGDIWFSLGDFAQAREGYQHSLSLDPCYWPAHRFWADTLLKEGDLVGARDRTAVAVACNPEYDIGWRFLEVITTRGGGAFRWVPVSKPAISDPSDDLPADGPFSGAAGQLYRTSRASAAAEGGSVLQIERSAVERTLAALPGGGDASGPLWQRLSEAQDAGYLDEAIFIFLLDEALLAEFLEYRSENLSRLSRYITEQLAPL